MWNPFSRVSEATALPLDYKPSLYSDMSVTQKLTEQFKGEVEQKKITFPEELGEEHPFDFKLMESLYKKFGFYTAVIDKYIDYVVGPGFYIECEDARGKEIIEDFMQDVNFDTVLRAWCKEGLNKGNGFLEIGGSKTEGVKGLKILNANYLYVVRDNKGKVEGYNQYKGDFDKFAKDKVIPFNVNQIAHFPFNVVGDCAYGLGIGYISMGFVDNWLSMQKARHQLMDRKANAPLHAQFGYISDNKQVIPKTADIQALGKDIEIMSNKTNWVTDPLVNFKVVDFGDVGGKFDSTQDGDLDMLMYSYQIPAVIMGKANVPEGLAKVQMEGFQRRIQSIQSEMEKIIEEKIFKRVLEANGLDVHVEFEWGTPSIMEVEGRMTLISEMIKSPMTGDAMKSMLQDEMISLLKFDEDEWAKLKLEEEQRLEEERKRLEAQPQPIVPGQNARFPQKVAPKKEQPKQPKPQQNTIDNVDKIQEDINSLTKKLDKKDEDIKAHFSDAIKELTDKLGENKQEIDVDKIKDEIKKEINVKMDANIEKIEKILKQKLTKKKSLLQSFKSKDEPEETNKLKVFVKRKKKNYENEKSCAHHKESFDNINDIEEWLGFSYKKYLANIITAVELYEFDQLKAVNEIELEAGYLSTTQVTELRGVLDKGFKKGQGMTEMAKAVDKKVGVKDLYKMTEDGQLKVGASGFPILSRSADKRAIGIVRTEVTRLANMGAEKYYKDNGIVNERWLASFGDRTCPDCEALNGTIYEIGKDRPDIPLHPMCRCTLVPVVELV